jgi:hypothetical protein
MTPRQYVEAILDGTQSFNLDFTKVVIFKGNDQLAFLDENNTEEGNANTAFSKDSRYFGISTRLFFHCLKDIQRYGVLQNIDESYFLYIDPERWLKVADFPQIVIMNYIEDGNIDTISLIADDETMLTLQIRSGEYDVLFVAPIQFS